MNWNDMKTKYPQPRETMNEKEEIAFVNDCFTCYENDGFAETFNSPYEEQKQYNGRKFSVVERCSIDSCDLCTLPMWTIQFDNGDDIDIINAYPEEIISSEIAQRLGNTRTFQANELVVIDSKTSSNNKSIGIVTNYTKGNHHDILNIQLVTPYIDEDDQSIKFHTDKKKIMLKESSINKANTNDIIRNMSDTELRKCLKTPQNTPYMLSEALNRRICTEKSKQL